MVDLGESLLFDLNYSEFIDLDTYHISKTITNIQSYLSVSVRPGIYQDNTLKKIVQELYDYLLNKIELLVLQFDKQNLLYLSIDQLGRLMQNKFVKMREMNANYRKKSDPQIKKYNDDITDLTGLIFSTQFIIEKTIQIGNTGLKRIDSESYSEILSTTKILLELSIIHENLQNDILKYSLKILDNFSYEFNTIDIQKVNEFYVRFLDNSIYGSEMSFKIQNPFNYFNEIDPYFRNEFGLTFTSFYTLLVICISILLNRSTHTINIKKLQLMREIKKVEREMKFETINSFLNVLSLSSNDFSNIFYPTHIRNRKNRIVIKPFVSISHEFNCEYIINIWIIYTCSLRWTDEISAGYLPYKDEFVKTNLREKLQEIRQKHNYDFEKQVEGLVKEKTSIYETRIKYNEKCFSNLGDPCPGEIDVFAIFKEQGEVYLIDAKDFQLSRLPRDMYTELKKYIHTTNGYFVKMKKKKVFVENNLEKILNYYGIDKGSLKWTVKCFFVTATSSIVFDSDDAKVVTISQFDKLINQIK